MFKLKFLRSTRSTAARIAAAISLLILAIGFLLLFPDLMHLSRPSLAIVIKAFLIFILGYASYRMVLKRIGIVKIRARGASVLVAIADLALGYFYLGEWVLFAGFAMFGTWIILSI